MEELTVGIAIEVQTKQLNEWKCVLAPIVYRVLVEYAQSNNEFAKITNNHNDVYRGVKLTTFIENLAIKAFAQKTIRTEEK